MDAASASAVLRDYLDGRANPDLIEGTADHKGAAPVLVFSGMGPQWWGMGRELMATQPASCGRSSVIESTMRSGGDVMA